MNDTDFPESAQRRPNKSHMVRLGISSCLLGYRVRYDGGHKWDRYLVEVLGPRVEWVAVCPEAEIGLGIPRPPIQLEGRANAPQLIIPGTGDDLTETMKTYALKQVGELRFLDIAGFVFKSRSPSCGITNVKVFEYDGSFTRTGTGAFAAVLRDQWPELPTIDEIGLSDPKTRNHFFERLSLLI
jgi:uncharacterized protein YbbK (DUF523 family)